MCMHAWLSRRCVRPRNDSSEKTIISLVASCIPPVETSMTSTVSGETLIKQGAEALAYISHLLPASHPDAAPPLCVRKHRPPKPYRHPVLDARLTKSRILAESRLLARLRRAGVVVPAVLFVDALRGDLYIEYIHGPSIRDYLFSLRSASHAVPPSQGSIANVTKEPREESSASTDGTDGIDEEMQCAMNTGIAHDKHQDEEEQQVRAVMLEIGRVVALMHNADVVHGDLTTSNLLLRSDTSAPTTLGNDAFSSRTTEKSTLASMLPTSDSSVTADAATSMEGRVVVIDLGLGSVSLASEDAAVDLYVLERAFLSTHPNSAGHFDAILQGYTRYAKRGKEVLKRLAEVRKRGRKRTMVG